MNVTDQVQERPDETPRVKVLIAQIEHTAQLAVEDGSEVTASKLRAHLVQFAEASDG